MKKVFYIEKQVFLREALLSAFKDESQLEIFSFGSAENLEFILRDMAPSLILVDLETALPAIGEFAAYDIVSQIPVVCTFNKSAQKGQMESICQHFIEKPISPFELITSLKKIMLE